MKRRIEWLVSLAVPMLVSACGASAPDEVPDDGSYKNLHALHHDLALGASGEAVRELHQYLAKFGYFPNDKLARTYPAWRPVVATPPADATTYDQNTEEAVRKLQQLYRLPVTGIVDEATRAALTTPRCGVPDGIPDMDPSNKFSIEANVGYGIPHPLATYRFTGPWEAADRVSDAIYSWTMETDQTIIPANNPNLYIYYQYLDRSIYGWTGFNGAGGIDIKLNANYPFYTGSPESFPPGSPDDITDLQTIAVHELGHALGLGHSGFYAVMLPATLPKQFHRHLEIDDKVAISIKRDTQVIIPGFAPEDIAVGNVEGSVWIINGPDHSMWKWDGGSGFVRDAANGDARAIAVGNDGRPWVAAPWGVYRRTSKDPTQGTWQKLNANCALDIGIGTEKDPNPPYTVKEAVWMIDCSNNIFKFDNGLFWYQDIVFPRNTAARIAVDTEGLPWVVSTSGVVYHRATTDQYSGWYADLPASLPYHADIGVGPCCYGWGVRRFPAGYPGGDVTPFQYQPGGPDVTGYWRWLNYPGQAVKISVGPKGDPWWFDAVGRIWHSRW